MQDSTQQESPQPGRLDDLSAEQRSALNGWIITGERYSHILTRARAFDPSFEPSFLTVKYLRRRAKINVFKLRRERLEKILTDGSAETRARRERQRAAVMGEAGARIRAILDAELAKFCATVGPILGAEAVRLAKVLSEIEGEKNPPANSTKTGAG